MISKGKKPTSTITLALAIVFSPLLAHSTETWDSPDAPPIVSVLTIGPGQIAFDAFGHNAFRVRDPRDRSDLVYNFGTFRFNTPLLIVDFLMGRFKYWLGVKPTLHMMTIYRIQNRFSHEQILDLPPQASRRLVNALVENAEPENRVYLYNYYRDNCSTRVRDAIDRIFDGALERQFDVPGKMTLREHSLRATADILPAYLGIDIVLGDYIDQPETVWQEMFLPEILEEGLAKAVVSGPEGRPMPLVSKTRVVYSGRGGPRMRRDPPNRTLALLGAGLAIGAMLVGLAFAAFYRHKMWAQYLFSLLFGLFGLFAGLLGLLFLFLWGFTDHDPAYRNENLLQCAPWAILLAAGAWGIFRAKPRLERLARHLAASTLGAAALGLLIKLLPFADQDNRRIIAFFLPVWTALFIGTLMITPPPPARTEPRPRVTQRPARKARRRRRGGTR
jgi:hypothetical protein